MYPSVDEQPKHAGGSHNYENPSHPIHGYPQPAAAVGIPAYDAYNNTNNYPQIPQIPQQQQLGHPSAWTAGLCGCGDDCGSCCLTCWCPCITFGQIAEIVDSGSTSCGVSGTVYALLLYFTGCACCYSCFYRKRLRSKFNLEEKPCGDCLVHFCCESCALCQEYRELKNRGFDPSLGWVGNLEKQNLSVPQGRIATAPPLSQDMEK
eukprot:PITA_36720